MLESAFFIVRAVFENEIDVQGILKWFILNGVVLGFGFFILKLLYKLSFHIAKGI